MRLVKLTTARPARSCESCEQTYLATEAGTASVLFDTARTKVDFSRVIFFAVVFSRVAVDCVAAVFAMAGSSKKLWKQTLDTETAGAQSMHTLLNEMP